MANQSLILIKLWASNLPRTSSVLEGWYSAWPAMMMIFWGSAAAAVRDATRMEARMVNFKLKKCGRKWIWSKGLKINNEFDECYCFGIPTFEWGYGVFIYCCSGGSFLKFLSTHSSPFRNGSKSIDDQSTTEQSTIVCSNRRFAITPHAYDRWTSCGAQIDFRLAFPLRSSPPSSSYSLACLLSSLIPYQNPVDYLHLVKFQLRKWASK